MLQITGHGNSELEHASKYHCNLCDEKCMIMYKILRPYYDVRHFADILKYMCLNKNVLIFI